MERPPVFSLEVLADRALVKDVVKGMLILETNSILLSLFLAPPSHGAVRLPAVDDPELEELIDQRTNLLIKSIEASVGAGSKSLRGQIAVEFYERRPKKAWFSKAEEKVCWEQWLLSVTLVNPRNDSERVRARASIEHQLQKAVLEIITTASIRKDHIPPITNDTNPFPYQIIVSPKGDTWGARIGIF
ncbi:hypothetical protein Q9L58_003843 [Maublancomyces gigas]|uniref:Autophagy-related protein 101 n=1 Tax=Discina gigas TaxID=1032678 RepID=A0ABR3GMY4_9PEZI